MLAYLLSLLRNFKERAFKTAYVSSTAPVLQRPRNFQWYRKLDNDASTEENDWQKYSEIENEILEDGYNEKQPEVEIDGDLVINFTNQVQYNKNDTRKQQAIKRVQLDKDRSTDYTRKGRFLMPISIDNSTKVNERMEESDDSGPVPLWMLKDGHFAYTYRQYELKKKKKLLANIIEDAAEGIIKEGTRRDSARKAEWLAKQLLGVKDLGIHVTANGREGYTDIPEDIGQTCIHLYTEESFLYKVINSLLFEPKNCTLEVYKSLGPFIWLLDESLRTVRITANSLTVYRSLNLDDEQRKEFMQPQVAFLSFTSTSTNRGLAEFYNGNTLLVINLEGLLPHPLRYMQKDKLRCGANISTLSAIPDEEEFLIWPIMRFLFVKAEYDAQSKKHIIYLNSPMRIY
jgi:hypothetical protein